MKRLFYISLFLLLTIANIALLKPYVTNWDTSITVKLSYKYLNDSDFQLFYIDNFPQTQFNELDSVRVNTTGSPNFTAVKFVIPQNSIDRIRIDFGSRPGQLEITNIEIQRLFSSFSWGPSDILAQFKDINDISNFTMNNGSLQLTLAGTDPYIISNDLDSVIQKINPEEKLVSINVLLGAIVSGILVFVLSILENFITRQKISAIIFYLKDILRSRGLIIQLAKNDFKTRYAGSFMGIVWAFVQPIITVLIYWFVFQVGFRVAPMGSFPYLLWFIAGIVPWFFFSDIINFATNSLFEYSYLVKKVIFKVSILPLVKAITALFIHAFFIVFILLVYAMYGFLPTIYTIQILYYSLCTLIFGVVLSYATCAIVVFIKDFGQIIGILLQFGVWLTPIMWPETMVPSKYNWILKLNPIYYIVDGYRDTFINHIWFLEKPNQTLYFWTITLIILFVNATVFRKLKPHFADIL